MAETQEVRSGLQGVRCAAGESGKPIAQGAGASWESTRGCCRRRPQQRGGARLDERAELARLRKENAELSRC